MNHNCLIPQLPKSNAARLLASSWFFGSTAREHRAFFAQRAKDIDRPRTKYAERHEAKCQDHRRTREMCLKGESTLSPSAANIVEYIGVYHRTAEPLLHFLTLSQGDKGHKRLDCSKRSETDHLAKLIRRRLAALSDIVFLSRWMGVKDLRGY